MDAGRQVDALVRADDPADEDAAVDAPLLSRLDGEPDQAVVDQHRVPGLEHIGDRRGRDDEVAGLGPLGRGERDRLPLAERARRVERTYPQLRPL